MYPLLYSNLSTAFINPIFPSCIKSKNCKPLFVYFFAIEITNLKLASIISFFACSDSLSPRSMAFTKTLNSAMSKLQYSAILFISSIISLILGLSCLIKSFQPLSLFDESFLSKSLLISRPEYASKNLSLFILYLPASLIRLPSKNINLLFFP